MTEWRVLVVGGGTMGRGIAGLCADCGCDTRVFESDESVRLALRSSIESSWSRAVDRGKLCAEATERARGLRDVASRRGARIGGDADG